MYGQMENAPMGILRARHSQNSMTLVFHIPTHPTPYPPPHLPHPTLVIAHIRHWHTNKLYEQVFILYGGILLQHVRTHSFSVMVYQCRI